MKTVKSATFFLANSKSKHDSRTRKQTPAHFYTRVYSTACPQVHVDKGMDTNKHLHISCLYLEAYVILLIGNRGKICLQNIITFDRQQYKLSLQNSQSSLQHIQLGKGLLPVITF